MNKERQTIFSIVSVILLITIVLGISYAAFSYTRLGDKINTVNSGSVTMLYTEGTKFEISNVTPIDNETGKALTDKFEFSVLANSSGSTVINYEIAAVKDPSSTLRDEDIVMYLTEGIEEVEKFAPAKYTPIKEKTEIGSPAGSMILLSDSFNMGPNNKSEKRDYTFRMWVSEDIPSSEREEDKTYRVRIGVYGSQYIPKYIPPASTYVESLLADNSDIMNNDDLDRNIRYMGNDPDNYVSFNGELWRIIGVFKVDNGTGKKEKRLKIIRGESIGNYSWDTSSENNGMGINEWSGADLMTLLNEGPYYNRTSGKCANGQYNGTVDCDFTKTGLTAEAKELIDTAVWNTGTTPNDWNSVNGSLLIDGYYNAERSSNNGKICGYSSFCNDNVTRTTSWIGKVGLMYPSDYGYATSGDACFNKPIVSWGADNCSNNSWLYDSTGNQWTLTPVPFSSSAITVLNIDSNGSIGHNINAYFSHIVRPVVYLKANVKITSGSGTKDEPYRFNGEEAPKKYCDEHPDTGACYVKSLYPSNKDTMAVSDLDANIRYMGSSPSNYVNFNGELWRIIGTFNNIDDGTGKLESRLKIIREESIGNYSWDTSSENNGMGINEWSQADLMTLLNEGPYYNRTSGKCANGQYNGTVDCDFTSNGLTAEAKELIGDAIWNTGTVAGHWDSVNGSLLIDGYYNAERSNVHGKICGYNAWCNDAVERTTTWIGKIGLMYPSDYGYATSGGATTSRGACFNKPLFSWGADDCRNNSWLYDSTNNQWTLTPVPFNSSAITVLNIDSGGSIGHNINAYFSHIVRPATYLKANVKIVKDGNDGTKDHPYNLSL